MFKLTGFTDYCKWKVLDTDDGIEESFSFAEMLDIKRKGIKVIGFSNEFYTTEKNAEYLIKEFDLSIFKGKNILLPCDAHSDGEFIKESGFHKYFKSNFSNLGLQSLTSVCLNCFLDANIEYLTKDGVSYAMTNYLADMKSEEFMDRIVSQCDMIVTNPPFTGFKEIILKYIDSGKDFILLCPAQSIPKYIINYFKDNKLFFYTSTKSHKMKFYNPVYESMDEIWIGIISTIAPEIIKKKYDFKSNPLTTDLEKTDDGIYMLFSKNDIARLPRNFKGRIAAPVSFCSIYNIHQFKILDMSRGFNFKGCNYPRVTMEVDTNV